MTSKPLILRPLSVKGRKVLRPKRSDRMYATGDPRWRKLREAQLTREPFCRMCRKANLLVLATDVDHIDGDPWNNPEDGSNFQSLCHACHSKKTYLETIGKVDNGSHGDAAEVRPQRKHR